MAIQLPRFRTQYDPDYKSEVFWTDAGEDEGLVQQHMRDECDINIIMAKYKATGELTHVREGAAQFGDFSAVLDYQEAANRIIEADALFMELPASVRDRFTNDPGKFLDFATNPDNLEEMRSMGLAPPAPLPPQPSLVKVVAEPDDGQPSSKK